MKFEIPALGSYTDLIYALNFVKGMMTSSGYQAILVCTIPIALIVGLNFNIFSGIQQGNIKRFLPLSWIFGGLVYMLFIGKTVDVIVVNKDSNSPSSGNASVIKGVPLAPAFYAWIYGTIVDAYGSLAQQYGSPILGFNDVNLDISYKLITDMPGITQAAAKVNPLLVKNMHKYVDDCVMTGVSMGRIDVSKLQNPKKENVWDLMKFEGNVYTMPYYLPNSLTVTRTCAKAHDDITKEFIKNEQKIRAEYCSKLGYEGIACKNTMDLLTNGFFNQDSQDFILNYIASKTSSTIIDEYIKRADKQTNISNTVSGIMAEKWIPSLTVNMFIVVLLFTPMIFMLIFFSPGGVLQYYAGMLVWLILWAMSDKIIFIHYQRELYDLFKHMRATGLGINDILTVSSDVLEKVGLYGKMRWATMTLSLGMSAAILKIGNHAMANMAQDIGNSVGQAASQFASAFSSFGGTEAARDSMLREQGRAMAASQTPDSAILNESQFGYSQGISSANQYSDYYGDAYSAGQEVGGANAVRDIVNAETTNRNTSQSGGVNNYVENMARANNWDYQEAMQVKDMLSNHFGSDEAAIGAMSELRGKGSIISTAEMQGVLGAYGDDLNALTSDKERLAAFNHMSALGNFDANEMHRNAMGISTRDYVTAAANKFTLDNNMAATMNDKYNTDAFEAEQMLSFSVGENGMTNMIATRASVDGTTKSGHLLEGATETVMIGSDGRVLQKTYTGGIVDGKRGELTVDGEGKAIFQSGESGKRLVHSDVDKDTIDKGVNVSDDTIRKMATDAGMTTDLLAETQNMSYDEQREFFRPYAEASASLASRYRTVTSTDSSSVAASLNISAEAWAQLGFNAGGSGAGVRSSVRGSFDASKGSTDTSIKNELQDYFMSVYMGSAFLYNNGSISNIGVEAAFLDENAIGPDSDKIRNEMQQRQESQQEQNKDTAVDFLNSTLKKSLK